MNPINMLYMLYNLYQEVSKKADKRSSKLAFRQM